MLSNSTIDFLLLYRTIAVQCRPLRLLPPLRRSQSWEWKRPIDCRKVLQFAASGSPMESIFENGKDEVKRKEEMGESPALKKDALPSSALDLPPTPPEKPDPGDCCGSGCIPCVWDSYYDQLEEYTKSLEAYNMRVSSKQK